MVFIPMNQIGIDQYLFMGGEFNFIDWNDYQPNQFYKKVKQIEKTYLISDGKVRLKSKQFQIA